MSFCVSHRSALDKNLRHLYSGLPSPVILRTSSTSGVLDGSIDVMDRVLERHKRPPERFEAKFQEYLPQYSARLPRAPAFRSVSPEEARQISNRLSRPTVMSAIRRQSAVSRGAAERAESRRSRATSGGIESSQSGNMRDGLGKDSGMRDGDRCRKISYQDWSDEENGAYYYEDDESSIMVDSNEDTRDRSRHAATKPHIIDFNAAPTSNIQQDRRRGYQHVTAKRNVNEGSPQESEIEKKLEKVESEDTSLMSNQNERRDTSSNENHAQKEDVMDSHHSPRDYSHDRANGQSCKSKNPESTLFSSFSSDRTDAATDDQQHAPSHQSKETAPNKKISILEQIMQARTSRPARKSRSSNTEARKVSNKDSHTTFARSNTVNHKNPSSTDRNYKRLQKREILDSRLKQSPYCEPMPQLYIVYTPVPHRRENHMYPTKQSEGRRCKTSYSEVWSLHNRRPQTVSGPIKTTNSVGKEAGFSRSEGGQRSFSMDPSTQKSTRETNKSSYGAISTSSTSVRYQKQREVPRSKSVPPPLSTNSGKSRDVGSRNFKLAKSSLPKSTESSGELTQTCFRGKPNDQQNRSLERTRNCQDDKHASNKFEKSHVRKNYPHFESSLGKRYITADRLDQESIREDTRQVYCRGADGALYSMTHEEEGRRFASPEEMSRANKRLQKPTKVKIIRDRMRWAPKNNKDLADPVRVIREVTGEQHVGQWRRRKGDDLRGNVDGRADNGSEDGNHTSSNEDEENNSVDAETEKEVLANKKNLRMKILKNKKYEWVKKGVIQPRKNLATHSAKQPQGRFKASVRHQTTSKPVAKERTFSQQLDKNGEKKEGSRERLKDQKGNFPRPYRRSRSPSPMPASRSSSRHSSSSTRTVQSKSSARSKSRSRSRSSSRSTIRSRSSSRSSKSYSKSRSPSPVEDKSGGTRAIDGECQKDISNDTAINGVSLTNNNSSEMDPSTREKSDIPSTATNNENAHNRPEKEKNNDIKDDERNSKQQRKPDQSHVASEKTIEKGLFEAQPDDEKHNISHNHQLVGSEPTDAKVRGTIRDSELGKGDDKTTELLEGSSDSHLDYTTGNVSEGRGGDYSDTYGRGEESVQKGWTSVEPSEDSARPKIYTNSRQTRGGDEDSPRSDKGTRESSENDTSKRLQQTVSYTVLQEDGGAAGNASKRSSVNDTNHKGIHTDASSFYMENEEIVRFSSAHNSNLSTNDNATTLQHESIIQSRKESVGSNRSNNEFCTHNKLPAHSDTFSDHKTVNSTIVTENHTSTEVTTRVTSTFDHNSDTDHQNQNDPPAAVYNRVSNEERHGFVPVDLDASWRGQD